MTTQPASNARADTRRADGHDSTPITRHIAGNDPRIAKGAAASRSGVVWEHGRSSRNPDNGSGGHGCDETAWPKGHPPSRTEADYSLRAGRVMIATRPCGRRTAPPSRAEVDRSVRPACGRRAAPRSRAVVDRAVRPGRVGS
jgi:hypothetical protein